MLARADAKALTNQPTTINSLEFWNQIVTPYQEIASQQQKFVADPTQIRQLLVILLDNALKYTHAGDTITVTIKAQNGQLAIDVSDTGIGISPEAQKHIFDRFYRADHSRTQQTGGSGLGLAIAQLIVQQHQGHLAVQANHPAGTKMLVRLPLKSPRTEKAASRKRH